MKYSKSQLWQRFQKRYTVFPNLGLALDLSRMNFPEDHFAKKAPDLEKAFGAMAELERGALANRDEGRMVGHYWLRHPALAPAPGIRQEIEDAIALVKGFAAHVHCGAVRGAKGPFANFLLIGIGGSALGPQFVASALGQPGADKMVPYFFDNTDPDGMDKVLAQLGPHLGQTLVIVVSKSGETKETRNGMLTAKTAFARAGLDFAAHAVAVTMPGKGLDKLALEQHWLNRFPIWDWVGGRTSELSAVGLLPAALQGFDIDSLLEGARACDEATRLWDVQANPAAQLALSWHYIGNGKGTRNMVVLPYKDRLELFSKYLQQLVMESLGKREDLDKHVVHQGMTVLGNKGSTDQHSYIQQLRDGLDNFFVSFIEVLRDQNSPLLMVEPEVTPGDYLEGFLLGTRQALFAENRESVTITLRDVSAFTVGVLIALFERTVGLYASLININAYHQPGVQAGKKAADTLIQLQTMIIEWLRSHPPGGTASEIADACKIEDEQGQPQADPEAVFKICEHLAANPARGIRKSSGASLFEARYQMG